jgi:hypothetical protein
LNTFSITQDSVPIAGTDAARLLLKFADPASNDLIVRDVDVLMRDLKSSGLTGGRLILLQRSGARSSVLGANADAVAQRLANRFV